MTFSEYKVKLNVYFALPIDFTQQYNHAETTILAFYYIHECVEEQQARLC